MEVDDEVAGDPLGHLGDAIGAALVIGTGDGDLGAEVAGGAGDPHIVGGDDDAAGGPRLAGALVDVLNERLAPEVGERLAGEAGGGVARRNHDQRLGQPVLLAWATANSR